MSHVDLGYSESCEPWQVACYNFPSKIGGKPSWLNLEGLPSPEKLQCGTCERPLTFLCQIYAPIEDDPNNFHRTFFVFICRNSSCCKRNTSSNIKVFRNSLPRENKFYDFDPPDDGEDPDFEPSKWVNLCGLCGCLANKQCSNCKGISYCSREHQVLDWEEGHSKECRKKTKRGSRVSNTLFNESEIVIEAEDVTEQNVDDNEEEEEEELEKFEKLELEGKTGTMKDLSDTELEKYAASGEDIVFAKFKEAIGDNTDQILRYEKGGEPLFIAAEPKPGQIPNCNYCSSERQFEFQIMPQLFSILHDHELDVGIIAVYTCSKSCTQGDDYKAEFVFKQDVASNSIL